MKRMDATVTLLAKIKREAKAAAREGVVGHSAALEVGARAAGWPNWHELKNAAGAPDERDDAFVLDVDPDLPAHFDSTANEDRSAKQLASWWDRPFAITLPEGGYEVRCLDGGAWDRSTWYGHAPDLDAARSLAQEKLARWQKARARLATMLDDGVVKVIRPSQHPHQDITVLKECGSMEEASAYIRALERDE